jgi:hypothetical protein
MKLLKYFAGGLLSLATVASSAYAENYQKIAGKTVDFYVDADIWAADKVTVVGDNISFNTVGKHVVSDDDLEDNIHSDQSHDSLFIAVAHQGVHIDPWWNVSLNWSYSVPAQGGETAVEVWAYGLIGKYENSVFNFNGYSGLTLLLPSQYSTGEAISGTYQYGANVYSGVTWDANPPSIWSNNAMMFRYEVFDYAYQHDYPGTVSSSVDGMSFTLTTLSAVPEPEQAALMLAGLIVLSAVARKKRQS